MEKKKKKKRLERQLRSGEKKPPYELPNQKWTQETINRAGGVQSGGQGGERVTEKAAGRVKSGARVVSSQRGSGGCTGLASPRQTSGRP